VRDFYDMASQVRVGMGLTPPHQKIQHVAAYFGVLNLVYYINGGVKGNIMTQQE
jgi:hypothetical protein